MISLARTPHLGLPLACALSLILAGCATTPAPRPEPTPADTAVHKEPTVVTQPRPVTPVVPVITPVPSSQPAPPTRPSVDPAAAPVIARLAAQLLVAPESIAVLTVSPAEWPDACLGLAAEGEICGMMITPGYAISLAVGADTYEFRTDLSGGQIRVASAPPAHVGDPLVTWRDTRSFNMMIVGTKLVASGRRGRPLIAAPLAVPARATELEEFLARFAPFQAMTPAGEIALRGVGPSRASETDQRMIAEWARLVNLESRSGVDQPGADIAVAWERRGGIAGFCDAIEITRTGSAIATTCRGGVSTVIATIRLSVEELGELYGRLDRFEAFSMRATEPGATADAMTTALEFRGTGVDEATEADQRAILAWIDALAVRLRETALR